MTKAITTSAICRCTMGTTPSLFRGTPFSGLQIGSQSVGTVMDYKVGLNFPQAVSTFGMCQSLANPEVLKATNEANGVLQPRPCKPVFLMPWLNGSYKVLINNLPALNNNSQLLCKWLGVVSVTESGSSTVTIS